MLAEWKNPETGADSNSFSLYDPTAVSKKKKKKKARTTKKYITSIYLRFHNR